MPVSASILFICKRKQTSQPQNTENLETAVKKSGDFSKNLEIDRPADESKKTHVLIKRKCFFPASNLLKTCVDLNNTEIYFIFTA